MLKPKFILLILIIISLTGCASSTQKGGTTTLAQLQDLNQVSGGGSGSTSAVRTIAIQETAMSISAQSGLAWRAKQINAMLTANTKDLDRAFNFNLMMLPHNVLPPVLEQGDAELNLADNNTIRIADRTYQIESQARFVTTPPNWRDYLWLDYAQPPVPDNSLLPKNAEEREIWREYSATGWKNGVTQADNIYTANLARLKRDFMGMITYRALLAQNIVSPPFVASTNLGVTGTDSDLRINDQVLRITALPALQTNSKLWKPVILP